MSPAIVLLTYNHEGAINLTADLMTPKTELEAALVHGSMVTKVHGASQVYSSLVAGLRVWAASTRSGEVSKPE